MKISSLHKEVIVATASSGRKTVEKALELTSSNEAKQTTEAKTE
jgi:hypothetical protein